jgi:hypothetical protein
LQQKLDVIIKSLPNVDNKIMGLEKEIKGENGGQK